MHVFTIILLQFLQELRKQLLAKQWEKALPPPASKVLVSVCEGSYMYLTTDPKPTGVLAHEYYLLNPVSSLQSGIRTGIMGIERNIEKKQRETGREVSQVSRLMEDLYTLGLLLSVCMHTFVHV